MKSKSLDDLLTPKQVAELLGISNCLVVSLEKEKLLPVAKRTSTGRPRFRRKHVENVATLYRAVQKTAKAFASAARAAEALPLARKDKKVLQRTLINAVTPFHFLRS